MPAHDDQEARRREAEEVGCSGLVDGYATVLKTGERLAAVDATKADGPFICSSCLSDAVVRKCADKRDHFAHHTPLLPVIPRGESALHAACKTEICDALVERFPDGRWQVERRIPENTLRQIPTVVPDISGRVGPLSLRLAIEVQASALTIPRLQKRMAAYHKRDIPLLWVVPLVEEVRPGQLFRPRSYERYLHALYFGRAYYWLPGMGASVLPIHYGPARRYIDFTEWFDVETGEEQTAGGFEKTYKVIKAAVIGPPMDIADAFRRHCRGKFVPFNEKRALPPSTIWLDRHRNWWDAGREALDRRGDGRHLRRTVVSDAALDPAEAEADEKSVG